MTFLDTMAELIAVAELPEDQRVAAAESIEARFTRGSKIQRMMLTDVIAGYSRILEIGLQAVARREVAGVALAVERYRLAKGRLPDGLSELVPAYLAAVPKDPFDGEELRFKRLEKGYVVYSIGQDGSDDGGKEPVKKSGENWDITFIVER